ncbi:MAG: CDP-glucose 4,6-dehydratase [Methanobrevibacter sp.]|jgi:CDP-glucose 4,6-dehydratase|nr:CDP-glucose 4,6-dehydratase [Candidatus Methanovirga aequatorialis]
MLKKFKDCFQDKKILVTGHTGFKGSWLTTFLLNLDADIIGFSKDIPTNPSMFEVLGLKSEINHIIGDIRNYSKLNDIINQHSPDIIIHLAAQPIVRESYLNPVETYETNVMGTINLLESLRINNSKNESFLLNVTSDKCYENKEKNHAYNEEDSLGGYDPYSSSKTCSEIATAAYRRSFFTNSNVNVATARAGNVIGGGDWSKDRIVVDCVNALFKDETIVLRNPNAIRPWQHVLEALAGYLTLLTHMINNNEMKIDLNSSWNFGPYPESIVNVENLVKELIAEYRDGQYTVKSADELHEANLLELDINKSLEYLDWKPKLNFKNTIKMTVEWYKKFYNNDDMLKATNNQIKEYLK